MNESVFIADNRRTQAEIRDNRYNRQSMNLKKYRKRRRRILGRLIFLVLANFILIMVLARIFFHGIGPEEENAALASPTPLPVKAAAAEDDVSLDGIYSPNAILVSLKDNKVIAEKDSEEKIYPASLTKIMTAEVAIEESKDLNRLVRLSPDMFSKLYDEGASMAGFLPGEEVTVNDLLYGALLPSGAECCIGLADDIAGSEEDFVKLMNNKARELGMDNTNFTNVTGLHDDNHYTTVKDLAVLLEYALKDDVFRNIFTSERHSTQPSNQHPDGITFHSTMFHNLDQFSLKGGRILGGKTGYTDQAGLCLASLAEVGQNEYILVTAGAEGNHDTEQYNISDAIKVYGSIDH